MDKMWLITCFIAVQALQTEGIKLHLESKKDKVQIDETTHFEVTITERKGSSNGTIVVMINNTKPGIIEVPKRVHVPPL